MHDDNLHLILVFMTDSFSRSLDCLRKQFPVHDDNLHLILVLMTYSFSRSLDCLRKKSLFAMRCYVCNTDRNRTQLACIQNIFTLSFLVTLKSAMAAGTGINVSSLNKEC